MKLQLTYGEAKTNEISDNAYIDIGYFEPEKETGKSLYDLSKSLNKNKTKLSKKSAMVNNHE